jgi:hypothetical protein
LPLFTVGSDAIEYTARVTAEVELEAKKVLGIFGPKEYDTLRMVNILSSDRLNRDLEQMAVLYPHCPLPSSEQR